MRRMSWERTGFESTDVRTGLSEGVCVYKNGGIHYRVQNRKKIKEFKYSIRLVINVKNEWKRNQSLLCINKQETA